MDKQSDVGEVISSYVSTCLPSSVTPSAPLDCCLPRLLARRNFIPGISFSCFPSWHQTTQAPCSVCEFQEHISSQTANGPSAAITCPQPWTPANYFQRARWRSPHLRAHLRATAKQSKKRKRGEKRGGQICLTGAWRLGILLLAN